MRIGDDAYWCFDFLMRQSLWSWKKHIYHINTNTQHNSKKLCAPWQIVCTALLVKELRQRWPSNGQFHTEFIRPPVSLADCWTQGKYDERAPCPMGGLPSITPIFIHFRPCCHVAPIWTMTRCFRVGHTVAKHCQPHLRLRARCQWWWCHHGSA